MGNQERREPTTLYGKVRISIIVGGILDQTKRSRRQFLISLAAAGLGVATFATGRIIYLNKIEQEKRDQQKEEISQTEVFRRDGIRQRADDYSEHLLQEFMKPGLPIDVYFSEFSDSFDSTQGFKIDTVTTPIKIGDLNEEVKSTINTTFQESTDIIAADITISDKSISKENRPGKEKTPNGKKLKDLVPGVKLNGASTSKDDLVKLLTGVFRVPEENKMEWHEVPIVDSGNKKIGQTVQGSRMLGDGRSLLYEAKTSDTETRISLSVLPPTGETLSIKN